MRLPQLIVFDLDFTLWDCGGTWCDCLTPPFQIRDGRVIDRTGRHVQLYEDVIDILDDCDARNIPIAVASRTEQPDWARQLLDLLGIRDRFAYEEIDPSSKLQHFAALQQSSAMDYPEMLFFDDERRNIEEVSDLGVLSILVPDGMHRHLFDNHMMEFADRFRERM